MSFNNNPRPQHRVTVTPTDVHNDISKSVQLLMSGAPLLLLSRTTEGYVNPLMANTFSKPTITLLAVDEGTSKYYVVPGLLYDLVLGKGKAPEQVERDRQILNYITNGGYCPKVGPSLAEKIEELRDEYASRISELKSAKRQN